LPSDENESIATRISSTGSARVSFETAHRLQFWGKHAEPKGFISSSCETATTSGKSLQIPREVNSTTAVSSGPRLDGGSKTAQVFAASLLINSLSVTKPSRSHQ